jgi:hypothetical protein
MQLGQWRVRCDHANGTTADHIVNLPVGSAPAEACPDSDPDHIFARASLRRRYLAEACFGGHRAPPGADDDSDAGWAVGSRCLASDGNLWLCTSAAKGAAQWRNLTGGYPALVQQFTTAGISSDSFAAMSPTIYLGRSLCGAAVGGKALVRCDASTAGEVRLWNVSTSKVVAGPAAIASTSWAIVDVPLDSGAAFADDSEIWQWEIRRTSGAGAVYMVQALAQF